MAEAIVKQLSTIPLAFIKMLTFNNEKTFADHQQIADQLEAGSYFTPPYTSLG